MALLTHTCPHCHVERVQFRSVAQVHRGERHFTAFFACNSCKQGVVADMWVSAHVPPPHEFVDDITHHEYFRVSRVYPQNASSSAPEHTPDSVAKFYVQALDNLKRKHFDAAGAMCRKALDVGTRKLDDTLKGNLKSRIDDLAATHKITPAMKQWAHAVRLDGNDAVHEEEFNEDDAKQLASFTELFLMYAFMLPGRLAERAKKNDPKPAAKS